MVEGDVLISDDAHAETRPQTTVAIPLSSLERGRRGRIARVLLDITGRRHRLAALGVTAGAAVRVLQTFPVIVFECDQTELAIERAVARVVLVDVE
jgi:Fe2+ transport system protein FeoA